MPLIASPQTIKGTINYFDWSSNTSTPLKFDYTYLKTAIPISANSHQLDLSYSGKFNN